MVFWNLIADLTKEGFRTILRNKTESLLFDYCFFENKKMKKNIETKFYSRILTEVGFRTILLNKAECFC